MWMILLSTALAAPLHHAPPPSLDAGFGMVDPVLVPGTSLLLTGDRALAVWDLEAGALRARLPVRGVGHESTEQTALQPWALQGGGMVRVVRDELARWPLDGSGPTDVLQARSGPVLDVHARGILVEDSDAPGLRLVDSDGQTVWTRALDDTPWAAAFRADGGAVAVTIGSDPVLVLDAETGEVRRRLETALDEDVTGLHWQGDTLLAYGRHGSARAWGPRATRPSAQADFTGALRGQQYGRVLAHDGDQWTILTDRLWVGRPGALAPLPSPCPAQAAEGAAVRTLPAGGDGARISVSPQGICLHGPTPRMLPVGATEVMTDVDWGPDRRLLTTGSRLLRWELDQGEATVLPLGGDRPPDQLSATADLATVASAALGGWGPVAGWPARRVALPADARAVALAPDGSGLLVSTHRGLVAVSSDGQRQETVAGPRSGHQLAWGGAGRLAWQGTLWADPGTGFAEVAGADTLLGGRTAPSPRGDQALWATDAPVPGGPTHQLHRGGAGGPATVVPPCRPACAPPRPGGPSPPGATGPPCSPSTTASSWSTSTTTGCSPPRPCRPPPAGPPWPSAPTAGCSPWPATGCGSSPSPGTPSPRPSCSTPCLATST